MQAGTPFPASYHSDTNQDTDPPMTKFLMPPSWSTQYGSLAMIASISSSLL